MGDKKKESTQMVHMAIDYSGSGQYQKAINILTKAISIYPNNAQAYFERGMALMELNKDSDAIVDFDRALQIDPNYSGARDWRARALTSLGKNESAAEDQLKSLRNNPNGKYGMGVNPQSWADCAESFIAAGKHSKARQLLEEYFKEHSKKVSSYASYETAPMRVLSKLLLQDGEIMRATELARKGYLSEHKVPSDILNYALALEATGETTEARKITMEAIRINDQMPGLQELNQRLSK